MPTGTGPMDAWPAQAFRLATDTRGARRQVIGLFAGVVRPVDVRVFRGGRVVGDVGHCEGVEADGGDRLKVQAAAGAVAGRTARVLRAADRAVAGRGAGVDLDGGGVLA